MARFGQTIAYQNVVFNYKRLKVQRTTHDHHRGLHTMVAIQPTYSTYLILVLVLIGGLLLKCSFVGYILANFFAPKIPN